MSATRPRVFISYSHDSDAHCARVTAFARGLADCAEVLFDAFAADKVQDWPLWCEHAFRTADRVIVVVTENYKRRYYGETPPGSGDGVYWEGRLIRNFRYRRLTDDPRLAILLIDPTAASFVPDALADLPRYLADAPAQMDRLRAWIVAAPSTATRSDDIPPSTVRSMVAAGDDGDEQATVALIDVVDFTQLARARGAAGTARLTSALRAEVERCAAGQEIEVIKMLGDAALLWIGRASCLPEFFLRVMGREGIRSLDGENVNVRMVATSGFVSFTRSGGRVTDAHGPELIRLFRIEKYSAQRQLLITAPLLEAFSRRLEGLKIGVTREIVPQLKGFVSGEDPHPAEASAMLIRLTPPRPSLGPRSEADALGARMAELAADAAYIRILADLWDPLPMAESYIKLRLTSGSTPHASGGLKHLEVDYEDRAALRRGERTGERLGETPAEFFATTAGACIVGLPGSGKTTLLRHFAHFTFNNERERAPGDDRAVVVFVSCRHLEPSDFSPSPGARPAAPSNVAGVLRLLTTAFLKTRGQRGSTAPALKNNPPPAPTAAQVQAAADEVIEAWTQGRALVLIDALDEADLKGGTEVHHAVRAMFKLLIADLRSRASAAGKAGSRCYLTARQVERDGLKALGAPIHDVNALSDDDLREFAGHLLATDETLLRLFRNGVTEDPVIARIGGTPLTATLLVHHFRTLRRFEVRYAAYDMFCVFMLGGFWELDKQGRLPARPEEFRAALEAKAAEPGVSDRYDALAELCFTLLHGRGGGQTKLNLETLEAFFLSRLKKRGAADPAALAGSWIKDLVASQMLISAGGDEWHFLHLTVMEYLAARHLVAAPAGSDLLQTVCDERGRDGRETLPIACSHVAVGGTPADVARPETGYRVLAALRARFGAGLAKSTLPIRCLAEVEGVELRHYDRITLPDLREERERIFDGAVDARAWLYVLLADLVSNADAATLTEWEARLASIVPLPRDVLVRRFLA